MDFSCCGEKNPEDLADTFFRVFLPDFLTGLLFPGF
jgi:hypothetical protein